MSANELDIIRPGDGRYPGVRHVYTATGSPAAVVVPRSADEVAEALVFARDAGTPFAVRSGGHGISSVSTNDGGTVIDLSSLDTIERSRSDGRTVRLGPGARWGHVARKLYPWGLAISSGDSGDVGVGGLATTGGIGLMARAHGLTIDHLVSADVVTADGRLRRVDADHEPDLFWAVRGAGANVGIVTSFEFRADPVPVVVRATVLYEAGGTARFLRDWGVTVEQAPREVSAFLYLFGGEPAGRTTAQATVVYAGDDTDAATRALEPFLRFAPVAGHRADLTPYAAVVTPTDAPHSGQQSAWAHTGLADHLDPVLSGRLERLVRDGFGGMVQVRSVGGAVNDVPPEATAYAHRHQNFSVTAVSRHDRAGFDAGWDRVRASMDGIYLSFESDHAPERLLDAFPPATLERLRAVKRAWDPDGIFDQNFDVTPLSDVAPLVT